MLTELDIYDFENLIEGAIQTIFDSVDVKAFTPTNVGEEFLRDLPRCEAVVEIGASGDRLLPQVGLDQTAGSLRELDFAGRLTVAVMTYPDNKIHSAYRAKVRNLCSTLKRRVNGVTLLNHKIQSVKSAGCNYYYEPQKAYRTDLNFSIKFSISPQAVLAFDLGEEFPEINPPVIPAAQRKAQVYYGADVDPNGIIAPADQTIGALYYAYTGGVYYVWGWVPVQNIWTAIIK
jgi:hypothetical protein